MQKRAYGAGAIRALPSGRFQAKVRFDGRLVPAPETFDTRGDAGAWLKRVQRQIQRGTFTPPAPKAKPAPKPKVVTVGGYAATWLAQRELKPRTRRDYELLHQRWIEPAFGDQPIGDVTPADVRAWYADLAPGRPTARAHAYALLRSIMATAAEDDLIAANPCRIRGATAVKRASETKVPTFAEVAAITGAMPDRLAAAVALSAWCGLRYGEAFELRRGDVDLDAQVVRVRRGVTWVKGKPIVGTPKSSAGIRDVAIPPHIIPVIARHLDVHVDAGDGALLFPTVKTGHGHMPTWELYDAYYPARKAAGRPDLRWHDLRHFQATIAAATGATLAELMQRLGHSTPQAALKYQHATADRQAAIAAALSDFAGSNVVPLRPRDAG